MKTQLLLQARRSYFNICVSLVDFVSGIINGCGYNVYINTMNKGLKIIASLLGSFILTLVLSKTLFLNYSPRLNPSFLADARQGVSHIASSIGKAFQNQTKTIVNLSPVVKKTAEVTGSYFGFNIHSLTNLDSAEISETLNDVHQCDSNAVTVVRFWGFLGGDRIQKVLDAAPSGMKFIIALSNFYTSGVAQPWPAPQGNETAWFADGWKTNGYRDFVDAVTKKYSGNDKILVWELMNEPNCSADQACSDAQHDFIRQASDLIAANDPNTLISPGYQAQGTGGEHFENGDYEMVTQFPNITANSCHMYGDNGANDFNPAALGNCEKAMQIVKNNNKFFYIGEAGLQYGCTTASCTNSCSSSQLNQRKDMLLAARDHFIQSGSNAFVIWQFDLPGNEGLSCDGTSVFAGDPLCPATNGGTIPTNTPVPGQPTNTPVPGQPTNTPVPNPTTPPHPTTPPVNQISKVQINVHVGTTGGALFSGTTPTTDPYKSKDSLLVYIEGPSSNGHRFGEMLNVPGSGTSTCTSRGAFPYSCSSGSVIWSGADNASGTAPGSYTATLSQAPTGWHIVTANASGTLTSGQTLVLDLAIAQ